MVRFALHAPRMGWSRLVNNDSDTMARYRSTFVSCFFVSLITLWLARIPHLSYYTRAGDYLSPASSEKVQEEVDLSRVDAPFVAWPLARVCKEAKWTPGLVFVCDDNSGGIGNIKNYMLTCIRYGIEAGATGLVLPKIRGRSNTDLANLFTEHQPFDYFFDKFHFKSSLTTACPQITIYDSIDDIPHVSKPVKTEKLSPKGFGKRGGCDGRDLNRHFDKFGESFRRKLDEKTKEDKLPPISLEHPRVYAMAWGIMFEIPVYRDGPEFVATFGGLLRFRKDILELGFKTTKYMRQYATTQGTAPPSTPVGEANFTGMHLRTESDSLDFWPKYEVQSKSYLDKGKELKLHAAYLATGNETEADKLTEMAKNQYLIGITTKRKLLSAYPDDLKRLDKLTWDQQALIDFIVLSESQYFMGVNPSSFSMTLAIRRHLQKDGLYTRPWKIGGEDERSKIIGDFDKYWDNWLFFYESIWP